MDLTISSLALNIIQIFVMHTLCILGSFLKVKVPNGVYIIFWGLLKFQIILGVLENS